YDEVLTTSVTWQPGLVEFWYARREMLAELGHTPYSKALEDRWSARFSRIDLAAPGRWIERKGVYTGAGVWLSTPMIEATYPTYRTQMKRLLSQFLCVRFTSIDVDSQSLLSTVGNRTGNLRALGIQESPM